MAINTRTTDVAVVVLDELQMKRLTLVPAQYVSANTYVRNGDSTRLASCRIRYACNVILNEHPQENKGGTAGR